MGGHIDDGEEARENPVVSVSIGSPCVFLLGGYTKDEAPIAILLRSGDCLVLGGKARLRYHGVSKVFVATEGPPSYLAPSKATQYAEKGIHCAGCNCFLEAAVKILRWVACDEALVLLYVCMYVCMYVSTYVCKRNES